MPELHICLLRLITSLLSFPSKREEEKKRSVLTNPVKMKEIRKMVSRLNALHGTPERSAVTKRRADLCFLSP